MTTPQACPPRDTSGPPATPVQVTEPDGRVARVILRAAQIPALDGLRGVAILLVIVFHHTVMQTTTALDGVVAHLARLGWCGVDLFFVLSGFLITGILVDSKGGGGYYRNFYVRRTLRIFPLYYAVVSFSLMVLPSLFPASDLAVLGGMAMQDRHAAWYWLYVSNVLVALDEAFRHPILSLSWSLAIEEQFYLIWPVVVGRLSRRGLVRVCIALIVAAPVLRAVMLLAGAHPAAIYVLTFCRMDALAAGGLLAVALRSDTGQRLLPLARRAAPLAAAAVLAIWTWDEGRPGAPWGGPVMQSVGYSVLALLFAAALVLAVDPRSPRPIRRLLEHPVLRMFGKYSYALYLFHVPIRRVVRDQFYGPRQFPTWFDSPLPGQLVFYVVATAPALALAWLSWHGYEKQWLKLRRFFDYDWRQRT